MRSLEHLWVLVNAAGDERSPGLARSDGGPEVPRQFWPFEQGPSLLQRCLRLGRDVADPLRLCVVVAEPHRRWWQPQLDSVPRENIIAQPRDRGTGHAVLLGLLSLMERDPQARLLVLPADSYFEDEDRLARHLRVAAEPTGRSAAQMILLGLAAETGMDEGYIVPGRDTRPISYGVDWSSPVERLVAGSTAAVAGELEGKAALGNSVILAADAQSLLQLFVHRCADVVVAMRDALTSTKDQDSKAVLAVLYDDLPGLDFCRDVLNGQEQHLRVLAVPDCGWSDLSTPERVARAVQRHRRSAGSSLPVPAAAYGGALDRAGEARFAALPGSSS